MYYLCVAIQYVGIIVVLIGLAYLLQQWASRPQSIMLFLSLAVLINEMGYLFEITSGTLDSAIMATKISYIGKVFIPLLALLFVFYYCGIKLPNVLMIVLTAIHMAVLVLVLTLEYHTLFYTEIGFAGDGMFSYLIHRHGIGYVVYMALILCYAVVSLLVCWNQIQKTEGEEKEKVWYLLLIVLCPTFGLVLYLSGLTKGYDTTEVCYVISGIILLVSIFRTDFFDTVNLAKDYVVDNLSDGLVVLGNQDQFVYANAPALRLFPELKERKCNKTIRKIRSYCREGTRLHVKDKVYVVSEQEIIHNRSLRGKMIYLQDVTDGYNYTAKLETEVWEKKKKLLDTQHSLIVSLANMVEARDGVTGLHIMHTSSYVEIIARALQKKQKFREVMTDDYVAVLSEAAPLHDIGKISMPDAILRKEGSLTTEERKTINSHPVMGAQIIDSVLVDVEKNDYLGAAREMAYYHHERWDGSGYPEGLKGEEIPLSARIMAIADVYDALLAKRSYKGACTKGEAKQIIMEQAGKQFDPELVEVFLENIEEIEQIR